MSNVIRYIIAGFGFFFSCTAGLSIVDALIEWYGIFQKLVTLYQTYFLNYIEDALDAFLGFFSQDLIVPRWVSIYVSILVIFYNCSGIGHLYCSLQKKEVSKYLSPLHGAFKAVFGIFPHWVNVFRNIWEAKRTSPSGFWSTLKLAVVAAFGSTIICAFDLIVEVISTLFRMLFALTVGMPIWLLFGLLPKRLGGNGAVYDKFREECTYERSSVLVFFACIFVVAIAVSSNEKLKNRCPAHPDLPLCQILAA